MFLFYCCSWPLTQQLLHRKPHRPQPLRGQHCTGRGSPHPHSALLFCLPCTLQSPLPACAPPSLAQQPPPALQHLLAEASWLPLTSSSWGTWATAVLSVAEPAGTDSRWHRAALNSSSNNTVIQVFLFPSLLQRPIILHNHFQM